MRKIIAAFVCAAAMLLGTAGYLPQGIVTKHSTITASANVYGDYFYTFTDDGTVTITKYIGEDRNIVVPDHPRHIYNNAARYYHGDMRLCI